MFSAYPPAHPTRQAVETRRTISVHPATSTSAPGIGLSNGAADLDAMWRELLDLFSAADANSRNATVLCGFIHGAHARDSAFANATLESLADGVDIALDILHMHFYRDREEGRQRAPS